MTPDSIAEGGGFLWLGTYNTGQTTPNDNYIYRSADDGATWTVVNTTTTHRHIHGLRYNNGKLYAFIGDADGDGIWVSADNGVTLTPLCTEYGCVAIDAAFDPANAFMIFGTDNFTQQNKIVKVALSDGARSVVQDIPYTSFSTFRLNASTFLIGTTLEGGVPIVDPNLHLFASFDGGTSFQDVYQTPISGPGSRVGLEVHYAYSNGDFPILVNGHGTLVARLVPATAPANTALPTVSGTARVGQALTGSNGTWTGSAPITYENQWRLCNGAGASCADIAGATGPTYTPVAGDVGKTVRLRVTATNSVSSVSADSAATAAVLVASPLGNTVLPGVSGTAQVGQVLTGSDGTWTGTAPITFVKQWRLCDGSGASCADIAGATGPTYTPVAGDVGKTVRLRVTATNPDDTVDADSAATAVVIAASSGGGGGGGGGGGRWRWRWRRHTEPQTSTSRARPSRPRRLGRHDHLAAARVGRQELRAGHRRDGRRDPPSGRVARLRDDRPGAGLRDQRAREAAVQPRLAVGGCAVRQHRRRDERDGGRRARAGCNDRVLAGRFRPGQQQPDAEGEHPGRGDPAAGAAQAAGRRQAGTREGAGAAAAPGCRQDVHVHVGGQPQRHPGTAERRRAVGRVDAGRQADQAHQVVQGRQGALSLLVPKKTKGKSLRVKIKVTASGQTATRVFTYRVH